ncbi:MAG: GSCFA domain-containing protein [Bacteroidales bacterium]|nr:GSCFA domain-containing protein [Bacteroidales bacterium]
MNNSFRTEINIPHNPIEITHQDVFMFMGSCFAEEIGRKMQSSGFVVNINPFGILFNPQSIVNCLNRIIHRQYFAENELDFYNNQWFSFWHHGSFACEDKQKCLENINRQIDDSFEQLSTTDYLVLTLGSAYAYLHKEKNYIVANCHKLPQQYFERILLDVQTIEIELKETLSQITQLNEHIRFIFTISPIRYVKYNLEENMLSKSILKVVTHRIVSQEQRSEYFPAYEIMMDDLRDYRFYQTDMIHPNETAVNYIWTKFSQHYFSASTQRIADMMQEINLAKQHIIRKDNGEELKKFQQAMLKKIEQVQLLAPYMSLETEKQYFNHIIE